MRGRGREGARQAEGGRISQRCDAHPSTNLSTNNLSITHVYHTPAAETPAGAPHHTLILAAIHPPHALKPYNQHTHPQ